MRLSNVPNRLTVLVAHHSLSTGQRAVTICNDTCLVILAPRKSFDILALYKSDYYYYYYYYYPGKTHVTPERFKLKEQVGAIHIRGYFTLCFFLI